MGNLFLHARSNKRPDEDTTAFTVKRLPAMKAPTLDLFRVSLRARGTSAAERQPGTQEGRPKRSSWACLLHDTGNC